jgi:hypothetical protein
MKDVNQKIADLSLDWREASDLRFAMGNTEKNFPNIMQQQSPAFHALWMAIKIACNRSVNEKRPTR